MQAMDIRNGMTFVYLDQPWKVLDYKHTHLGRRSADVRVKIRNLVTGVVKTQVFSPEIRLVEAEIVRQPLQFLYQEGKDLVFMHPTSFEQVTVDKKLISEMKANFLRQGGEIVVLFWEEKPIGIDLPTKIVLTVSEADPGVKGNSTTNIYKPAKLENGLNVKVPLFVKAGDKVKIDTRTGEYVERVS